MYSQAMVSFLEKHFSLIMKKKRCSVTFLSITLQDEKVKIQLKSRGKDPHFGQEKVLSSCVGTSHVQI